MSRPMDDALSSPPFQLQTVVMTDDEEMDALDRLLPGGSAFGATADRATRSSLQKPLAPAGAVEPASEPFAEPGWRSGLAGPRKRSVLIALVAAVVVAQAAVIGYMLRRPST